MALYNDINIIIILYDDMSNGEIMFSYKKNAVLVPLRIMPLA